MSTVVVKCINLEPLSLEGVHQLTAFTCDFRYRAFGPVLIVYILTFYLVLLSLLSGSYRGFTSSPVSNGT